MAGGTMGGILAWVGVSLLLSGPLSADEPKGWFRNTGGLVQSSPCTVNLDGDANGAKEIILVSLDDKAYVWKQDGAPFSVGGKRFPRFLGFSDGSIGSVVVGDVNGDGDPEIVVGGDDRSSKNPKLVILDLDPLSTTPISLSNADASFKSTVALIDCQSYYGGTAHRAQEMAFRDGDGKVYVYAYNGGAYAKIQDWTTVADTSDKDRYGSMPITPSVGAARLSGTTTLIASTSTDGRLYCWEVSSTTSTAWSVAHSASTSDVGGWFLSSPVLADLDDDGNIEILAGNANGTVYAWQWNRGGALSNEWSAQTGGWVVSSPAVADIDADGDLEMVVGCDDDKVYAFRNDGATVPGWPQSTEGDVSGSPAIAELDGVSGLEIVVTGLDRRIYVWHDTGALLEGWPKKMNSPMYSSPAIADLNGDGRFAIVTATFDGKVCVWELSPRSLNAADGWFQFRGDAARNGALP